MDPRSLKGIRRNGKALESMFRRTSRSSYSPSQTIRSRRRKLRRDCCSCKSTTIDPLPHVFPSLTSCHRSLEVIEKEVGALRGSSCLRRVGTFLKDPEKIKDMKGRLDEVLKLFTVRTLWTPPKFHTETHPRLVRGRNRYRNGRQQAPRRRKQQTH